MQQKLQVALISWDDARAEERRKQLESLGFAVEPVIRRGSGMIGRLTDAAPSAIVIDVDSKPSYGREVAIMIRNSRSARGFPLIFAGGTEEKIALVRAELPDAVYCAWDDIRTGVDLGIRYAPIRPVRPRGRGKDAVAGPILTKKMKIRAGMRLAIVGDAIGLGRRLGVEFDERIHPDTEIALAVARTAREAADVFEMLAAQLPAKACVWMIHPKQSGALHPNFTQKDVLAMGQAFGFGGFLMCAVDADWSGLRLVRKKRGGKDR